MDIYNESGDKLTDTDVDYDKGHVETRQRVKAHHPASPAVREVFHYAVKSFTFSDGTALEFSSLDNSDSHIKVLNEKAGFFDYADQGEGKTCVYKDIVHVTDTPASPAREAWDEYEDYGVYILYTADELLKIQKEKEEQKAAEEKATRQATFLEEGPDKLDTAQDDITSLMTMVSEMVGVE